MDEHKLGRDIGSLEARVTSLEQQCAIVKRGCARGGSTGGRTAARTLARLVGFPERGCSFEPMDHAPSPPGGRLASQPRFEGLLSLFRRRLWFGASERCP